MGSRIRVLIESCGNGDHGRAYARSSPVSRIDLRSIIRIPVQIAAERASISRMTLLKIEKGEPGVAMGSYATVLFVLGLADHLADLADPKNDPVGLQLEEEHLPKRIRIPRQPKPTAGA